MRPVHRSETRGTKCFWCAAAWLPLAADWLQQPLPPHASYAAAGGRIMNARLQDLSPHTQLTGLVACDGVRTLFGYKEFQH
jgi:hypothetical protein